ncbi:MAG: peptidoglycan recognition protein family protein [Thermoanaerobaculia bacterium]
MTRDELQASLNLTQDFVPAGRQNRPGTKIEPTFLTIHNTDNTSKGADARAHASFVSKTGYYMKGGKKNWVSWHFTVDDRRVIQHLPLYERGLHAGAGNAKSIGIEICMNSDIDQVAAFRRASELVALLLWDTDGSALDLGRVVPHFHWTKKKCPQLLLDSGKIGARWQSFLDSARAVHSKITLT